VKKQSPSSSIEELPDDGKPHRFMMNQDDEEPFISPEKRLEKRDQLFCDDDAVALAIKSGDLQQVKWFFEKGYPMNWLVKDTDGMCYEAAEMAKHHGHQEIVDLFKEAEGKGPPRQSITLFYENESRDFIMPNSSDDEKLFKAEIKWYWKLDPRKPILLYARGDVDKKDEKWHKLREGRKYVVEKL